MASCSDDRKVRIWRYSNTALQGNNNSPGQSNPYTVSEESESLGIASNNERYYSDSNIQENIAPVNSLQTKSFFSTPSTSKKRPRRISDYFSPKNDI